jgi:hypothetical protein
VRILVVAAVVLAATGCGQTRTRVVTRTVTTPPSQVDANAFAANLKANYEAPIAQPLGSPRFTVHCTPTGKVAYDTSADPRPVFRCTVVERSASGKLLSRRTDCSVQQGDGEFMSTSASGEAFPLANGTCPRK